MKHIYFRIYQKIFFLFSFFLSFREPQIIDDDHSFEKIPMILRKHLKKNVFIVTDNFLSKSQMFNYLLKLLDSAEINYHIFDKTIPNPKITLIEEAFDIYKDNLADSIIAYGGGSAIDLAKALGARVAKPHKSIAKMKGTLKILKKIPLFIAIPSTVGTGSEATLAAVVSNSETKEKYALMDPVLIPDYAIFNLFVIKSLPKKLIAETGMDALTHAIEAFIGKSNTCKSKRMAKSAVKIIFSDLKKAYDGDLTALKQMQLAAYQAGLAFTRAYVGNVHAIAHQMSAHYHLGHGYANAVILPHVLDYYQDTVNKKLATLMKEIDIHKDADDKELASDFIKQIYQLRQSLNIDHTFDGLIKSEDEAEIIDKAYREANPLYPVPTIFSKDDFKNIIKIINQSKPSTS